MDNDGEHKFLWPKSRLQLIIPPKTKKKTKRRGKPRKSVTMKMKGSLRNFVNLPLDIIFETTSYLEPTDLLRLGRLSEDFRAFFMSRASLAIWRRVLSLTGAPKCPSDLTEPQYVCLMFEKFCMACGSSHGRMKTDYILRLRLCRRCRDQNVTRGLTLIREVGGLIETILPLAPGGRDLELLEGGLGLGHTIDKKDLDYFRPEVDQILTAYGSYSNGAAKYHELVSEETEKATRMVNEGIAMHEWMKMRRHQKLIDDKQLTDRRYKRMLFEMKALGWEERYYPTSDIEDEDKDGSLYQRWTQCMFQPKEFNTRAWKRMLPRLTKIYEHSKQVHKQVHQRSALFEIPYYWPTPPHLSFEDAFFYDYDPQFLRALGSDQALDGPVQGSPYAYAPWGSITPPFSPVEPGDNYIVSDVGTGNTLSTGTEDVSDVMWWHSGGI